VSIDTTPPQLKPLLSVPEAAAALSVSASAIRGWIRLGHVKPTRLGKRVLLPAAEVARIVREGLPTLADAA